MDTSYRKLLDQISGGIILLREEAIEYANPAAAEILEAASPDRLTGLKLERIVATRYINSLKEGISNVHSGGGCPPPGDGVFLTAGGREIDVEISLSLLRFEKVTPVMISFRDISARKRDEELMRRQRDELAQAKSSLEAMNEELAATVEELEATNDELISTNDALLQNQEDLRLSEEQYRVLVESANIGITVLTGDRGQYFNPVLLKILGYPRDEVKDLRLFGILHPEDLNFIVENYRKRYAGEEFVDSYECRFIHRDGHYVWARVKITPITWKGQNASLVFVEDISFYKQIEKERDDITQRFHLAVEGTRDGLWDVVFTKEVTFHPDNEMWFSPQFKRLLGYGNREIGSFPHVMKSWLDVIHPEDFDYVYQAAMDLVERHIPYDVEYRMRCRDGNYRWFNAVGTALWEEDGKALRASGSIRDINDRKKAEQDLRESEERFKKLHEASFGGIGIHDKGVIIDANQGLADLTGYPYEELIGMNGLLLIAPEWRDFVMEKIVSGYEKAYDAVGIRKDGSTYDLEIMGKNIPFHGKTVRVTEFRDITGRKEYESAVSREKERLVVTLRSIGDGVIAVDPERKVSLMNAMAETMTGWSLSEAQGRFIGDVFRIKNELTGKEVRNPVDMAIEYGRIIEMENNTILIGRDGTERMIADSGAPIRDGKGDIIGAVLVFRDVTEKYRMERDLQRIQQLEAVGVLAGGIAHDFNNILTAILGNISLAEIKTDDPGERDECLREAKEAAYRAKNLTGQLLTFARGESPVRIGASITDIITESAGFIMSGSGILCRYQFADNLRPVEVDRGQISQVIQNLLLNAKDAMPGGGEIVISAENFRHGGDKALPLRSGDYILIRVRDNGVGIDDAFIDRIFDPYFSTKSSGHGLGLSLVYSIMKKH